MVVFEIEMQNDERPARGIVFGKRFFNDRAHSGEEIILQLRLRTGGLSRVGDHDSAAHARSIGIPGEILLDRDGKTRAQRPLQAVRPFAFIRITVVRVHNRPVIVEGIQLRARRIDTKREGKA